VIITDYDDKCKTTFSLKLFVTATWRTSHK